MGAHQVSGIQPADLPTGSPTPLDQVISIARPGYLPASHLLMRLPPRFRSRAPHHRPRQRRGSGWFGRLVSPAQHGRFFTGTGISTRCPSTTPVGLALGPDSPWAEQPGPGTLGHPAAEILTLHSLLMPAFSLPHPPHLDHSGASTDAGRSPTHPHT